jgi:hypothetical protein
MRLEIRTIFKISSWDEVSFSEIENGGKLTKASVSRSFEGGLKGESKLEYLMAYNIDGSAEYTGYERITGEISGKKGTFVLKHEGTYKDGIADAHCTIINNSGTQDLKTIFRHRGVQNRPRSRASHEIPDRIII